MATNLPSCFPIQVLEQRLKFLVNFTLLKYVKSQRSYGFLITKKLIFGFQMLDLKDHFSGSLKWGIAFKITANLNFLMTSLQLTNKGFRSSLNFVSNQLLWYQEESNSGNFYLK